MCVHHNLAYMFKIESQYNFEIFNVTLTLSLLDVQGLRELRSESYCFFLLKYENYELFNPTGGSPDVVHLIK